MNGYYKVIRTVFILLLVSLLTGCQSKVTPSTVESNVGNTQSADSVPVEETTNNTVYDVHFYDGSNTQISEDTGRISEIEFPSLEDVEKPGFIFTGWDTDIRTMQKKEQAQDNSTVAVSSTKSNETSSVVASEDSSDTPEQQDEPQPVDINPVYVDVRDKDNVVAIPSVYGNAGKQFTVPLVLCGKVNLCGIDICVHYNRNKLKLVKYENADKNVICNADAEKGDFHLNYISTANVTEEIHFCDLVFEVIRETGGEEDLNIEIIDIVAFDQNNDLITPETNVIDAKIYAY